MAFDLASAQPVGGFDLSSAQPVQHEAVAPKEGDVVPTGGTAPKGFYAVTGDDGKQTLRHESGLQDVIRALSDLPGFGMAERMGQGATRLAGKAASGLVGAFGGGPDAVEGIRGAVDRATELPPSNDPLVQGMGAVQRGAQAVTDATGIDKVVGNLPAGPRTSIEAAEEAIPDIVSLLGLRAVAPKVAATQEIARTPAEVAEAAGYTGLKTRVDLKAPGNQAITDALISKDAGIVPGQLPSVAALENARRVGPGRAYAQAEASIPTQLTMRGDPLAEDLTNLPKQVSQLPRSPDVAALQETMLSKPDFTRDELFANIREARERAKAHWKSDDPDKGALGDAYHSLANAYEDFAGRQLEAANSPVSLADWQAARTQMAKNYQAQGALRNDHFDPSVYARTAEKNPHLLTGNAAIVGHVANGLPPGAAASVGLSDLAPTAIGVGAGELAGHAAGIPVAGGVMGALAGPMIRAKLHDLITRGRPDLATQTAGNPALSYFFNQGRMPQGWNRAPSSPLPAPFGGYLPSPSMVNAGGGASTASSLESLGLTPDVQAAGAAHPGAARLAALREQLAQLPERPAEAMDFQGPQKWGDFSIAPQAPAAAPPGGIPFENVLEQGGTQRPPVGAPAASRQPGRVAKSPAQPNVRTPPGAPEITTAPPPGPSPAQLAFKNKLAADRLRKVAGDLRLEGPGGATGSPADRLRAALERQERGYARGGLAHAFDH